MRHNLITGGAGFIGSHLAEALLARGEKVTVIDDLSTGSVRNIDLHRNHPHYSYHIASIMDRPLMTELVDRCDRVFHLAAAVGVRLIVERPVASIETNIRGTEIVLELAARKLRPVLIASSSEVYGKGVRIPFSEDDDVLLGPSTRPRWSYACSKMIDEFLALAYWQERRMPVVIARLFNTVGPRQAAQYGMVIPRFVRQALANEPLTVYGDGSQTRAFVHVSDTVRALVGLMDCDAAAGQVFNVGSTEEITIADLARLIIARTGSTSTLQFLPFEQAYDANFEDLTRRVPDLTRISRLIGFQPSFTIEQVIDQVITHERQAEAK
jgi:UDP-glucose 4-epimerase